MHALSEWFVALDPTLRFYWGLAIFSTFIFVAQTVLSFLGMGDHDFDAPSDADVGSDATDDAGAMHLLSFRNVIYFLFGMSWAGVSLWHTIGNLAVLILVTLLVGCAFVAIFMVIFRSMLKLQHNGAFDIRDAVGKTVDVYLRIPANRKGQGKVQVSFHGSIQELDAQTDSDVPLPSGSKVRVKEVLDGRVLLVEP